MTTSRFVCLYVCSVISMNTSYQVVVSATRPISSASCWDAFMSMRAIKISPSSMRLFEILVQSSGTTGEIYARSNRSSDQMVHQTGAIPEGSQHLLSEPKSMHTRNTFTRCSETFEKTLSPPPNHLFNALRIRCGRCYLIETTLDLSPLAIDISLVKGSCKLRFCKTFHVGACMCSDLSLTTKDWGRLCLVVSDENNVMGALLRPDDIDDTCGAPSNA
ncbi:hypothetical protein L210DRAFT_728207 [Boletus edulis BED1]|uniref:Uncharacterized protein n=1 Tax=Boletus edulis BED1 TaxID=1328754 RepID=A0AAD4C2X5_BOLED|nr:hypothetical protein L210DRAFT_728207 [Boletus edulis BED1]